MDFIAPNKKKVQFADILGQDLVKVKYITPNNSQENLLDLLSNELYFSSISWKESVSRQLVWDFRKHLNKENFPQRVITQHVCLEDIVITGFVITGIVRVKNISYQKQVFVRYTLDDWQTYRDSWADFVPYSSDGITDKFSFRIQISNEIDSCQNIDFAICFRVGNGEYWDNNFNKNYTVEVRQKEKAYRGKRQSQRWTRQYQEW